MASGGTATSAVFYNFFQCQGQPKSLLVSARIAGPFRNVEDMLSPAQVVRQSGSRAESEVSLLETGIARGASAQTAESSYYLGTPASRP